MFYPESQVPEIPSAGGGGGGVAATTENAASNSIWNTAGLGATNITSPNPPAVVPATSTAQLAAQYREFLKMSEQKSESGGSEFGVPRSGGGRIGFSNGGVRKSGFGRGFNRPQSDGFGNEPQSESFGGFRSSDFGGDTFRGDTQRLGFKTSYTAPSDSGEQRIGFNAFPSERVGFRRPDGFSNKPSSVEGFQAKSDAFGFPPAPCDVFQSEFSRQHTTDAFGFQRPVESGFRRPSTLATRPAPDAFGFSSTTPDPLSFPNTISSPEFFPLGNTGMQHTSPVMLESPVSGAQTPTESVIREAQIFNPRKLSEQPIGPSDPAAEVAPSVGAPLAPPAEAIASSLSSPSSVPSPVPTNKDPGYYSESECSSNSSENFIAASFTKALQIKDQEPTGGVVAAAAPDHYDAQNFELTAASVLEEEDEEDEVEEKVEDWRCIKKPENQQGGGGANLWGFPRAPGGMVGDGRWGGNAPGSHKKQVS